MWIVKYLFITSTNKIFVLFILQRVVCNYKPIMATLWFAEPGADVLTSKLFVKDVYAATKEYFPSKNSYYILPVYDHTQNISAVLLGQRRIEDMPPNKWCPVFTGLLVAFVENSQTNINAASMTTVLTACAQCPHLFDATQKAWMYDTDCTKPPRTIMLDASRDVQPQVKEILSRSNPADKFATAGGGNQLHTSVLIFGRITGAEHEKNQWADGFYGSVIVTGGYFDKENVLFVETSDTDIFKYMAWAKTQPNIVKHR